MVCNSVEIGYVHVGRYGLAASAGPGDWRKSASDASDRGSRGVRAKN